MLYDVVATGPTRLLVAVCEFTMLLGMLVVGAVVLDAAADVAAGVVDGVLVDAAVESSIGPAKRVVVGKLPASGVEETGESE
jgi:hypothetical protein